jgi:hypothetical protein
VTDTASGRSVVSSDETLGMLIAAASRDMSNLVRGELELAKAEIRDDVRRGAMAGGLFGAAGFLVVLSVILLSIAAAYGLVAAGLHPGWAFLIVAAVYLVVAGVCIFVGKSTVKRIGPPERTIRTTKETAAFLKNPRSAYDTTATGT